MLNIEQKNITLSNPNKSYIQNKYNNLNNWFAKANIRGNLNVLVDYNANSEEFLIQTKFNGGRLNSFACSKNKDFYNATSKAFRKLTASLKTKKYKPISKKRSTQFENSKKQSPIIYEENIDDLLSEEDLLIE